MGFIKVKSSTSKKGKPQDTYKDGKDTLVVCGDRGALITKNGVQKVTVSVDSDNASIVQKISGFLPHGYMVQDWLNGGQ